MAKHWTNVEALGQSCGLLVGLSSLSGSDLNLWIIHHPKLSGHQ